MSMSTPKDHDKWLERRMLAAVRTLRRAMAEAEDWKTKVDAAKSLLEYGRRTFEKKPSTANKKPPPTIDLEKLEPEVREAMIRETALKRAD